MFIDINIMYMTYATLRPQCDIGNVHTLDMISLQLVYIIHGIHHFEFFKLNWTNGIVMYHWAKKPCEYDNAAW